MPNGLSCFKGSGKIKKSKMADPKWSPFKNMTQLLRHITSPAHIADLKGKSFGRTIFAISFVVIA